MACLLKNEPASYAGSQVKRVKPRSQSESESDKGATWPSVDPKPGELPMTRVKVR